MLVAWLSFPGSSSATLIVALLSLVVVVVAAAVAPPPLPPTPQGPPATPRAVAAVAGEVGFVPQEGVAEIELLRRMGMRTVFPKAMTVRYCSSSGGASAGGGSGAGFGRRLRSLCSKRLWIFLSSSAGRSSALGFESEPSSLSPPSSHLPARIFASSVRAKALFTRPWRKWGHLESRSPSNSEGPAAAVAFAAATAGDGACNCHTAAMAKAMVGPTSSRRSGLKFAASHGGACRPPAAAGKAPGLPRAAPPLAPGSGEKAPRAVVVGESSSSSVSTP
mmetsp:Transcript_148601/g.386377  ORF Transcript_148601/g.386377 Transcript_148601/m.386377 type:complete len:277 (+) Transcript_148601:108-938(+)